MVRDSLINRQMRSYSGSIYIALSAIFFVGHFILIEPEQSLRSFFTIGISLMTFAYGIKLSINKKKIGKERFKNGHPLYFKKIGTNICFICNKVYNIFSVHDRFCGACKRTSLYRNS